MSDFGFWELTLIALIALLVVGPARLPQLAQTAGYWMRRLRQMAMVFKSEFMYEADKSGVNKILGDTRDAVRDAEREIGHLDPLAKAIDEQIESGRFEKDRAAEGDKRENSDAPQATTDKPKQR